MVVGPLTVDVTVVVQPVTTEFPSLPVDVIVHGTVEVETTV